MKLYFRFFAVAAVLGMLIPALALALDTGTTPADTTAPAPETVPVGPSISNISVTDITDTSARIDVDSDEVVQGYVEYGTTEQYGASTPLSSEFSTSPSFLLENLTPETLYHYRVVVVDSAGTAAITGDETFTTFATPATEPPLPTEPATTTPPASTTTPATTASSTSPAPALAIANTETVSVSTSTARITWETNKSADSQVEYGTTDSYGSLTPLGTASLSHSVSLSSLAPGTHYYYRAISRTSSGEVAYSPAETFTTLAPAAPSPPVISNVSIGPVSTSTATISWTTSKPATSNIEYGTTTSYGSSLGNDAVFQTSHSRTILGLMPSTLYHFRIRAADRAGNTALGKDRTFTTLAVSAPAPAASETPSTPAPAVTTTPVSTATTTSGNTATTTTNAEILANIAKLGSPAAGSASRGGGLPVVPTRPLLVTVTPLDGQVSFNWRKDKGVQNGTIHTLIVKKEGTSPVLSRIDGDIIYDGPSTTFTDTNVENGKEYHYALYSYGAFGRFTAASRFKVVPQSGEEQVDLSAAEADEESIPPTFSRDLFRGTRGDDVATLQAFLAGHGFYPEALVTGYFGPLTKSAVVRYQTLNEITPVAGYVGPITREALAR